MANDSRTAVDPDFPVEAGQIAEHFHDRDRQLADREAQLTAARADFRRERTAELERLTAAREEIERLNKQTESLNREAAHNRDRTRKLAVRYARRLRHKWSAAKAEIESQKKALEQARSQVVSETTRLQALRNEFHQHAAEEQQRQREAWAELENQHKRLAAERAETQELMARREAAMAARTAELAHREKNVGTMKSRLELETSALRQEAAGLETRAAHARSVIEEMERKREELRAELLAAAPKPEEKPQGPFVVALDRRADRDLTQWTAELEAQDRQLAQEKTNLIKLKTSLLQESVRIADERKVLAEQFALLSAARAEWQDVEARTVSELEDFARKLRLQEEDLMAREQCVASSATRRLEESQDLEQLRATLGTWQAKLTQVSQLWHTERERREHNLTLREKVHSLREAALQDTLDRWERSREEDRERLRVELQLWADDRLRMAKAAEKLDQQARAALDEIARHAARALASEDLLAETSGEGKGTTRRLQVLTKRWEKVFDRKLKDIDERRKSLAAEMARVTERYEDVHRSLKELATREDALTRRGAKMDMELSRVVISRLPQPEDALPLAEEVEETPAPVLLPFAFHSRAA